MNQAKPIEPGIPAQASQEPGKPVLRSADLLAGNREVLIQHGDDVYRLKLTGNNKLILTK